MPAQFSLAAGFSFVLAGDLGIARFDNEADYKGTFVNTTLKPVLHLDYTTFIGPDRDLAGFSYLSGIGLSIKADVSKKDWYVESLQFGAKYLTGDNVQGWSLIFGYRF